jgi:hypothetical protein
VQEMLYVMITYERHLGKENEFIKEWETASDMVEEINSNY